MKIIKVFGQVGASLLILATVGTLYFNGKVRAQEVQSVHKGQVVGQVVDLELKPVVAWPVEIRGVAGAWEGRYTVAFTDADGTYQAFLPAGKYAVRAINRPAAEGKTLEVIKGISVVKADQIMLRVKVAERK